jgi:ADP-ribosylglycohydrolase
MLEVKKHIDKNLLNNDRSEREISAEIDWIYEVKSVLFGLAVGDALGVPVEFSRRETLKEHPVYDMMGYGSHNQPPGTWSDDSSMAFCTAEALTQGFDLKLIADNFVKWLTENYWTAHDEVFDIGNTTRRAISNLMDGVKPELAGGCEENDNGNGSLMRIAPLLFYLLDKSSDERFEIVRNVSSITHRHIRSAVGCFYYLEFAQQLLTKKDKFFIYSDLQDEIMDFLKHKQERYYMDRPDLLPWEDAYNYVRLLKENIFDFEEDEISSSGYVVDTLEASIWCLMTTDSYEEAVLQAVNLGRDTDTVATVTGALAGLLYGFDNIPEKWRQQIARSEDIIDLAERLARNLFKDLKI